MGQAAAAGGGKGVPGVLFDQGGEDNSGGPGPSKQLAYKGCRKFSTRVYPAASIPTYRLRAVSGS